MERHPHSIPIHYVPKGMDALWSMGPRTLNSNTEGHILTKLMVDPVALLSNYLVIKKRCLWNFQYHRRNYPLSDNYQRK